MNKANKIKLAILITMVIVISATGTYAWFLWSSSSNTTLTANIGDVGEVAFTPGSALTTENMGPVLNPDTDGNAITFNIRNRVAYAYFVSIGLNVTTLDSALKSTSFKYKLQQRSSTSAAWSNITTGDFSTWTTGYTNLATYSMSASTTKYFRFLIYIDGSLNNNVNLMGKNFRGTIEVVYNNANPPELVDGLIPVKRSGSNWVKADSENRGYDWYNYDTKQWANAVLVASTNRATYQSAAVGTTIPEAQILAYYVWIPRFKYKVWNINKVIGTDSYNAQTTGITIAFEPGTATTGYIKCTAYSFAAPTETTRNETCSGSNGNFYTHPAFTFGNKELTGFWVGKFELSSETPDATNGGGSSTSLTPRIKPSVVSWRGNALSNFWKVIYNMQKSSNIYGLSTSRGNTDSHMIKNTEWGAVAILTNSIYGLCTSGACTEIGINNYYVEDTTTYKTGCGAAAGTAVSTTCNAYTSTNGLKASTTGNITGVYDLSGGAWEMMMGNMSSGEGTYTYNARSAGSQYTYNDANAKYIDTYAYYATANNDQTGYNRARLGDASSEAKGWYSDYSYFPYNTGAWFFRGGKADTTTNSGIYAFSYSSGGGNAAYSTRAVLVSMK